MRGYGWQFFFFRWACLIDKELGPAPDAMYFHGMRITLRPPEPEYLVVWGQRTIEFCGVQRLAKGWGR